jgi:hypothetical protein
MAPLASGTLFAIMTVGEPLNQELILRHPEPRIEAGGIASFSIAVICLLIFGVAVASGLITTNRRAILLILGAVAVFWILLLSTNWRWATLALLIALPYAGVPGLALRQSGWPSQLKDLLLLFPAYLGAFLATRRERLQWSLPRPLAVTLTVLVLVVIVETVPVLFSAPLVALVGLKTWLFYVPLVLLPQYLFRTSGQFVWWMRALLILALIPAAIGLVEAGLIYAGAGERVYSIYGSLAPAVTQGFAIVGIGYDLRLVRTPSTFPFVTQYYGFLLAMLPLALGIWLGDADRRWRMFGGLATLILSAAGITSGARGFLVWLPVEVVLILWLAGRRRLLAILAAVVATGVIIFGSLLAGVPSVLGGLVGDYIFNLPFGQTQSALNQVGLFGAGVGSQSGATRYVLDSYAEGLEVWYAKVLYELGVGGLLTVVTLWFVILSLLWRVRRELRGGPFFAMGTALFVFALSTMINLLKGPLIDLDPLNVYFWFFVGLALTLPALSRLVTHSARASHADSITPTVEARGLYRS